MPVVVDIVREADGSRLKGREKPNDRTPAQRKVGMRDPSELEAERTFLALSH
jgi:hypothetical protein